MSTDMLATIDDITAQKRYRLDAAQFAKLLESLEPLYATVRDA